MRACVCARARVSVCVCACACAMCAVYVYLATCTPHLNVLMLNIKRFDKNGRERVEGDKKLIALSLPSDLPRPHLHSRGYQVNETKHPSDCSNPGTETDDTRVYESINHYETTKQSFVIQ